MTDYTPNPAKQAPPAPPVATPPQQAEPQRSTRADEVRNERRRKPGATAVAGLKLHVDKDSMDPNYEYRWVNDTPGRVQQLYREDWDVVEDPSVGSGVGSVSTVHVSGGSPTPLNAVLMRKRKEHYQTDLRAKHGALDEIDSEIRRGVIHERQGKDLSGVAYTPEGNSISK